MTTQYHQPLVLLLLLGFLFFTACIKREKGCTDKTALNFNPDAFISDTSCIYEFSTPGSYRFNRVGASSVYYSSVTTQMALIHDYRSLIQQFGNQVITDSTSLARLDQYYTEPAPILDILANTSPYSLASESYFRIDETANSLENDMSNLYNADSIIISSIDTITSNSLDPNKQGTPAVYITPTGLDLSTQIPLTLLGGLAFNKAINLLNNIENNNNSTVISGNNYTQRENTWDQAFAYYGAAVNLADYPTNDLVSDRHFQDIDNSGSIDLSKEYNFDFIQSFAARDLVNESLGLPLFNEQIFQAFLEGRTAISSKNDTVSFIRDTLLYRWERAIAATVVHHLKQVQLEMQQLGGNNENIPQLAFQWTAMRAYLRMIGYYSLSQLDAELIDLLALIGNAPVLNSASNVENVEYQQQLDLLYAILQERYQFSSAQMEGW